MRQLLFVISLCFSTALLQAQSLSEATRDAYMISRMAEKFHFQPKPVDDAFSDAVLTQLLSRLDERRLLFTTKDVMLLQTYRFSLDDEIKTQQTNFLQLLVSIYQKRITEADSLIAIISKMPFNFYLSEKLTATEDTAYTANTVALRTKWYKVLKRDVLESILSSQTGIEVMPSAQLKKYIEAEEPAIRRKIASAYRRSLTKKEQRPGGLTGMIAGAYCKAVASCYDPHTTYLPLTDKENLENELGGKGLAFGFRLGEDENGAVIIEDLIPGSPAFRCGQLHQEDKIESVQWEGKEAIDVRDAGLNEVIQLLDQSNHERATILVRKKDGTTTKAVTLWKEELKVEDEEKVKSFLLKGEKIMGYITLPVFYSDWESEGGLNGCANDVAKEIVKLKKSGIEGLILDIRYNGGGSVQEAVALAGLFIDAGPVAQIKTREAKVVTLKDVNRGTIYDGPLLLLVNGYSASASELLAGVLQDYNRALIVGSPTYGKATAQVILPIDTTITTDESRQTINSNNYVKMTISQLYRLNGKTAQAAGVQPDVLIPDISEITAQREKDNAFAIGTSVIDANKYYKPGITLPVEKLSVVARNELNSSAYFNAANTFIRQKMADMQHKPEVSLHLTDVVAEKNKYKKQNAEAEEIMLPYSIHNHAYEEERLQASAFLKEMNETWKSILLHDPCISLAYRLLMEMIK